MQLKREISLDRLVNLRVETEPLRFRKNFRINSIKFKEQIKFIKKRTCKWKHSLTILLLRRSQVTRIKWE